MSQAFTDQLLSLGAQKFVEDTFRDLLDRRMLSMSTTILNRIELLEENMAEALNAAITRLSEEVTLQLQQTANALAQVQEAVDNLAVSEAERTALQDALDQASATISSATEAVTAQADALAADNPAEEEPPVEEPPAEEEPVDPSEGEDPDPSPEEPGGPSEGGLMSAQRLGAPIAPGPRPPISQDPIFERPPGNKNPVEPIDPPRQGS